MKFCIMKDVITPDVPVFQQGFMMRNHNSEGIHDDLYLKVLLIQANKQVLIVNFDLCSCDRVFVDKVKAELGEKFGIKKDEILMNFTHTHSAVGIRGNIEEIMEKGIKDEPKYGNRDYDQDLRYYRIVKEKILKLTSQCFDNLEEGSMFFGSGTSDIGINRRVITPEGVMFWPNFKADYDKELFVIKLVDKQNNIKSVIFSYGCHPTSMSYNNYLISADFCGFACKHLEEEYKGATAVFLQGCGGDVKPKVSALPDRFKGCSFEECESAGVQIANDVIGVLKKNELYKVGMNIRTGLSDTRLYSQVYSLKDFEQLLIDNPKLHESVVNRVHKLMDMLKEGKLKHHIQFYISVWYLDDNLKIIGLEGEMLNTIGRRIKEIFNDGKTIVLGYSNGVQCYIPNHEALEEGGYERDSFMYMGLSGPFVPEIEDIIYGRIVSMKPE